MNVPLLDLKAQYRTIADEIDVAVKEVFETQYFIGGPNVAAAEEDIARYCGVPGAVGVSSGSDALLVSLMDAGIGPGDEVITTPYTFFATGGSIHRTGAKMVFADIDPVTYNIDPALIEGAVTDRTKAIMPVHLYGQMADMDPIMAIAEKRGLIVIEDACQAIGAEYKGIRAGAIGDYGCFSFFPSKNLGGAGDGGMVVCRDAERAARVSLLRNHGMNPKYYHPVVGGNFRLDAVQAAVVRVKLNYLDSWSAGRQKNAARYDSLLDSAGLVGNGTVRPPTVVMDRHIFNQYIIRVPERDALRAHLQENGVSCEVYYPVPLHVQGCFAELGFGQGDFPESEKAATETLALPVYPELTDEQAVYVIEQIAAFYG